MFGGDAGQSPGGELNPAGFHHNVLTKSTAEKSVLYVDAVPVSADGGVGDMPDNSGSDLVAGFGGGNALEVIYDELVIRFVRIRQGIGSRLLPLILIPLLILLLVLLIGPEAESEARSGVGPRRPKPEHR